MDNKAHLWRAWWKEQVEPKIPVLHSLQMRLALGYSALIAALLILMNTYPLLMSQNLMFRSQQTALANQAVVITNALTTADQLTPAGVEQSLSQVEDLNVQRILITDEAGLVLYDSQENGVAGKYALTGEVVAALRGNDAFSSTYQDGLFSSRGAWPVMNRNRVVGAVCLYETDGDQGALLRELQRNLRLISVVVCLAVLALFGAFSTFLSRRVRTLLGGIRTVREGEYTHRISMSGHDELAQLAETFNTMAGSLEKIDQSRRSFMGNIAHELRTPMTTIKGFIDGMLDGTIPPENQNHYLGIVSQEVGRLTRLIKNMLDITKLEAGEYKVNATTYDIWESITSVVFGAEQRLEANNIQISGFAPTKTLVLADQDLVYQVIYNLVDNAIKFCNVGGEIRFSVTQSKGAVTVGVRNTGAGIAPEALPYVFDRFYKEDKSRGLNTTGSGLGLHICKVLINLSGGKIWVDSKEGEYCEFLFPVPAPPSSPIQGGKLKDQ